MINAKATAPCGIIFKCLCYWLLCEIPHEYILTIDILDIIYYDIETMKSKKMLLMAFFIISSFCSCYSYKGKYYTYELEGAPSIYYIAPSKVIASFNEHMGYEIIFTDTFFRIHLYTRNRIYIYDEEINTEPYDLKLSFPVNNTNKIIFSEMQFQSENINIDLREKVKIRFYGERYREKLDNETDIDYSYYNFTEEELIDFKYFGIIDLNKYIDDCRKISVVYINYDNIDIKYYNDFYFFINFHVIFRGDYGERNYYFKEKFIRKLYKVWIKNHFTV